MTIYIFQTRSKRPWHVMKNQTEESVCGVSRYQRPFFKKKKILEHENRLLCKRCMKTLKIPYTRKPKMKIYLAGSMTFQDRYRDQVAPLIRAAGHEITSRWLNSEPSDLETPEENEKFARMDIEDIEVADAIVLFPKQSSAGGLHVELGIAIGRKIPIYVVANRPNLFYFHKGVLFFPDLDNFLTFLKEMK